VTSVGEWAFTDCTALQSIEIADSVISIGGGAFENTAIYNSQSGVVYVDGWACGVNGDCPTTVVIPSGTKGIAGYSFSYCTSLRSVSIPDSVTSIGEGAFYSCTSLVSVAIPTDMISIGSKAFWNCISLTSVTIPDSVTSIEYQTFYYCTALVSVTIPAGVTSIGRFAFSGCDALANVYYGGSETDRVAMAVDRDNEPLTTATWHYAKASAALLGDVDGNGAVNSTDARLTLQYAVQKIGAEGLNLTCADVDGSGAVNSTDARLILQYAVQKITAFPA